MSEELTGLTIETILENTVVVHKRARTEQELGELLKRGADSDPEEWLVTERRGEVYIFQATGWGDVAYELAGKTGHLIVLDPKTHNLSVATNLFVFISRTGECSYEMTSSLDPDSLAWGASKASSVYRFTADGEGGLKQERVTITPFGIDGDADLAAAVTDALGEPVLIESLTFVEHDEHWVHLSFELTKDGTTGTFTTPPVPSALSAVAEATGVPAVELLQAPHQVEGTTVLVRWGEGYVTLGTVRLYRQDN